MTAICEWIWGFHERVVPNLVPFGETNVRRRESLGHELSVEGRWSRVSTFDIRGSILSASNANVWANRKARLNTVELLSIES